ncbi:MAG: ABC transporter permease [Myxococcota bacterium]|nr:ABC transporter permease [Myxococcota bacterium]
MIAYIIRKLLEGIPTVFGVTIVTFLLFNVFGGNPVLQFLGKSATNAEIAAMEAQYGFDRPLAHQYVDYLGEVITFDFGKSFVTKEKVLEMIKERAIPSLALTIPALLATSLLSVCIALIAAFYRGQRTDKILMFFAVLGMSVSFLVYIVVGQYILAFRFPVFQIHGYLPGPQQWQYLILPMLIMLIVGMGYDTRFYRSIMVEETGKDYVRTAFAKGVSRPRALFVHVARNAMVQIVTRIMISVPFLVTGSLLLESFFGIPGMGSMLLDALNASDFPVIKAYTVMISILFVVSNLLTDVLYAIVDPRVRLG